MATLKREVAFESTNTGVKSIGVDGWFRNQVAKFEQARFGWMTALLTIQSCLAAVACMYILQNNASDIQLASCAALAMGCNAVLIAQGPGKWCLLSFYLSMILNTIFIIINI